MSAEFVQTALASTTLSGYVDNVGAVESRHWHQNLLPALTPLGGNRQRRMVSLNVVELRPTSYRKLLTSGAG